MRVIFVLASVVLSQGDRWVAFFDSLHKVIEHGLGHVLGVWIGAIIGATASLLVARPIWRSIRRYMRAATIRKSAGKAFVIVRCPIVNDEGDAIGNEIAARLETAFRAFAGWENQEARPFEVISFPLNLPGSEGSKTYDRGIETTKRWLSKTNGDVLIWGSRIKGSSIGVIRLIGRDKTTGTLQVRRVDFDKNAEDFDVALADAIAYEAVRLTQATLAQPLHANLDALRRAQTKVAMLSRADAPALSPEWRLKMAHQDALLSDAVARRSADIDERNQLITATRVSLASVDPNSQAHQHALTALRLAILLRKKNWVDPVEADLEEAAKLLATALPVFDASNDDRSAAEAALESVLVRKLQHVFLTRDEANEDIAYRNLCDEANKRVERSGDEALLARFSAQQIGATEGGDQQALFGSDQPYAVFKYMDRMYEHLDNAELLDVVAAMISRLRDRGGETMIDSWWRAEVEVCETTSLRRSTFTEDEARCLKAMQAESCYAAYISLSNRFEEVAGAPYLGMAERLSREVNPTDWQAAGSLTYLEYFILEHSTPVVGPSLARAVDFARTYFADDRIKRFPQRLHSWQITLAVALNNLAVASDSREAADEALKIATEVAQTDDRYHAKFILAFAASQVARLTSRTDPATREQKANEAHALVSDAMRSAVTEEQLLYVEETKKLLHRIETDWAQ